MEAPLFLKQLCQTARSSCAGGARRADLLELLQPGGIDRRREPQIAVEGGLRCALVPQHLCDISARAFKHIFFCKLWLRYSRARALSNYVKILQPEWTDLSVKFARSAFSQPALSTRDVLPEAGGPVAAAEGHRAPASWSLQEKRGGYMFFIVGGC